MTDLDFDELDKAVHSAMGTTTSSTAPIRPSTETTQSEPAASTLTSARQILSEPPARSANSENSSHMPLLRSKSGRFMDMIHPSADMRSGQKSITRASRTGLLLAPLSQATDSEQTKAEAPIEPEVKKPETELKDDITWADPLDFQPAASAPTADEKKDLVTEPSEETLPTEEIAPKLETDSASDSSLSFERELEQVKKTAPLVPDISGESEPTSPFLTDAKVEKRPLGGPTPSVEIATPPVAVLEAPKDVPKKPKSVLPTPSSLGDLNSESKDSEDGGKTAPELILPIELGKEITAIEADNPALHHATASAAEPPAAASPTFITQQYKEKASSGDQEHTAIYDNNTQPLAHPAKKKSGWGAVVWILIVILIFVGAAAALYFLNII